MNLPPPPASIIPRVGKPTLLDIEAVELARQLTIMENDLYRKIRPLECLRRTRQSSAKNDDSISAVIQLSNKVSHFVVVFFYLVLCWLFIDDFWFGRFRLGIGSRRLC